MEKESEGSQPPPQNVVIDEDMPSQEDDASSDIVMSAAPASEEVKRAESPGTPVSEWIQVLSRRNAREDARARADVTDFIDDIGNSCEQKEDPAAVRVSQGTPRESHIEVEVAHFDFSNDEPMLVVDEGAPSNEEDKPVHDPCRWANEAEAEEAQKKLEKKCLENELKKLVEVIEEVEASGSSLHSHKTGTSTGGPSDASLSTEEKVRATDGAIEIQRKTLADQQRILEEIRTENSKISEERASALNGKSSSLYVVI
jgi:hypothetical protein